MIRRTQNANEFVRWGDLYSLLDSIGVDKMVVGGPGVRITNTALALTIALEPRKLDRVYANAQGGGGGTPTITDQFFAKITAVVTSATSTRWTYSAIKVTKHTQGEGASNWEEVSGTSHEAFNLCEAINSESGLQGNGVDISGADFPAGMSVQPCPEDSIVRVWVITADDATVEWWFAHENAIDGACE